MFLFLFAGFLHCDGQEVVHAVPQDPSGEMNEGGSKRVSTNHVRVDVGVVLNHIPATMFGTCIEDVNHEIYGGLYAQMIMGESFEEPSSGVNYNEWTKFGGYWAADREYGDGSVSIIPGRRTRRMVGTTELDVEPDGSARLVYDNEEFQDGEMETELRFLQGWGNGAGIFLRASGIGIGDNALVGYEVRLNREANKLQLIKHQDDERLLTEVVVAFKQEAWQRVKVRFEGGQLTVYLNDSLRITYTDTEDRLISGRIGLATSGTPVSFRNVRVTKGGREMKLGLSRPIGQQVSDRWDVVTAGAADSHFKLIQGDAFNGLTVQQIELTGNGGKAGVANRGLNRWGMVVGKGLTYTGSCYMKTPGTPLPVTVTLESADGSRVYAQQVLTVSGDEWKEYHFSLLANASDTNSRFALYFQQPGVLTLDQVSLFPPSDKLYKALPLRADIGQAIVKEGVTFMRYGGTMVNAAGYRFKKMVGPRALRPPYTGHWNECSTNGFGIEEFLQFCEASHITPAFAINIEETPQDAADMVDYLNGDGTTTWGRKRIENGHRASYGVRYIEIGNEEVLFEGDDEKVTDHYIDRFLRLYEAIHSRDTSLHLVCSAWWRPGSSNTKKIFSSLDGKAAYWDYHVDGDNAASGLQVDKALTGMERLFHQWNPLTTMRCTIFEENGGLHNMQRGLGHATNLNAARRHGNFLLTSCPANALQPWHQNDNSWDQGQIFFTPDSVWGMPPYYVQQMAAANYLPLRVQDTVMGDLDVTATRDSAGKEVVLHLVNTSETVAEVTVHLDHFQRRSGKSITLAARLREENYPGNTRKVFPVEQVIRPGTDGDWHYSCPPFSYTIIRL